MRWWYVALFVLALPSLAAAQDECALGSQAVSVQRVSSAPSGFTWCVTLQENLTVAPEQAVVRIEVDLRAAGVLGPVSCTPLTPPKVRCSAPISQAIRDALGSPGLHAISVTLANDLTSAASATSPFVLLYVESPPKTSCTYIKKGSTIVESRPIWAAMKGTNDISDVEVRIALLRQWGWTVLSIPDPAGGFNKMLLVAWCEP